jgi:hypothetical protein
MRVVFDKERCTDSHRKCMKIILDRRQVQSEIVKVPYPSILDLDHPNAIPIKNRM